MVIRSILRGKMVARSIEIEERGGGLTIQSSVSRLQSVDLRSPSLKSYMSAIVSSSRETGDCVIQYQARQQLTKIIDAEHSADSTTCPSMTDLVLDRTVAQALGGGRVDLLKVEVVSMLAIAIGSFDINRFGGGG
jgi:hypothetical protein